MLNIKLLNIEPELKYLSKLLGEIDRESGIYHSSYRHPIYPGEYFYYSGGGRIPRSMDLQELRSPICNENNEILVSLDELKTGQMSFEPFLCLAGPELMSDILDLFQYRSSEFSNLYYQDELNIDHTPLIHPDLENLNGVLDLLEHYFPALKHIQNQRLLNSLNDFIEDLFKNQFQPFMNDRCSFYSFDFSRRTTRLVNNGDVRLIRYDRSRTFLSKDKYNIDVEENDDDILNLEVSHMINSWQR